MRTSTRESCSAPRWPERQEWILTSTDADPGLNVSPAPRQSLSLNQAEADHSWARMGGHALLSGLLPVLARGGCRHRPGICPLSRPLPLACRAKDWWWVPVVAPPLGAYLGGIIYLVFIGSSNPWEAQMLENPGAYEDRRISVLPKTSSYPPNSSSLTPVSVSPSSRPSIRPVPPLGDSVNLEQF